VLDPQAVLGPASQGTAPETWRVFTKQKGLVRGFCAGRRQIPIPPSTAQAAARTRTDPTSASHRSRGMYVPVL
jgi:hypothetical protein